MVVTKISKDLLVGSCGLVGALECRGLFSCGIVVMDHGGDTVAHGTFVTPHKREGQQVSIVLAFFFY